MNATPNQTPAPASAPAIEAQAVAKTYPGGVRALRGVSFRIAAGERACLLGPNGAGKTTLIRILIGAFKPTSGTARLFGAGVDDAHFLEAKRRVGIVPQSPGMYRDLSCADYLALVRELYGASDATVDEVVEAIGIAPFLTRPMITLSGGQQRKLSLAAALVGKPDLLLLDEPTAGLDPVATRDIHAYLREATRGRTVLLCTHNLLEAEALCDSAIILREGQALVHAPIEELRRRARTAIVFAAAEGTAALTEALSALGHAVEPVPGEDAVRLYADAPQREAARLLRALVERGLGVYESRIEMPSLEELFHHILRAEGADHGRP